MLSSADSTYLCRCSSIHGRFNVRPSCANNQPTCMPIAPNITYMLLLANLPAIIYADRAVRWSPGACCLINSTALAVIIVDVQSLGIVSCVRLHSAMSSRLFGEGACRLIKRRTVYFLETFYKQRDKWQRISLTFTLWLL